MSAFELGLKSMSDLLLFIAGMLTVLIVLLASVGITALLAWLIFDQPWSKS